MINLLASLALVFAQTHGSNPCNDIGHAGFPPPPLPPCAGTWDIDCLAMCIWVYSDDMAATERGCCFAEQQAWDNFDDAAAECEQEYDACLAAGSLPAACAASLNSCMSAATALLAAELKGIDKKRRSRGREITAGFYDCLNETYPGRPDLGPCCR